MTKKRKFKGQCSNVMPDTVVLVPAGITEDMLKKCIIFLEKKVGILLVYY